MPHEKNKMAEWDLCFVPGDGRTIWRSLMLPPPPAVQIDTESVQTWACQPVPALKERLLCLM